MRHRMVRRLALRELKKAERIGELAEHQQVKVRELESKSETELAVSIQQCYPHVFYPLRDDRVKDDPDSGTPRSTLPPRARRRAWDSVRWSVRCATTKTTVDRRRARSPAYIRDRTPLKKGEITTRALREEFRRDPGLPMFVGDDVFVSGIRRGIEQGDFVYRRGDLLYGPGDPQPRMRSTNSRPYSRWVSRRNAASGRGRRPRRSQHRPSPGAHNGPTGGEAPVAPATFEPSMGRIRPSRPTLFAEGVLKEALCDYGRECAGGSSTASMLCGFACSMRATRSNFSASSASCRAPEGGNTRGRIRDDRERRFQFKFEGPATDAQTLREFLEPQLRAAPEKR